jgi:arachidonate 15-lipoxygenase
VNRTGNFLLCSEGQIFDEIYAGDLPVTRRIITESARRHDFPSVALERDLEARGMADAPIAYPYRDDARLLAAAIESFVARYVELFYPTDEAVRRDPELSAWLEELASDGGGRLAGLPGLAASETRGSLARLLGQILFTAGPGHAAVHFPQPDYHAAVAAYPAAAYAPPPRSREEATSERYDRTLPPVVRAASQFRNAQLAGFRYDQFGDYTRYRLGSLAAAQGAVQELRRSLRTIGETIDGRNRERPRPYPYLLPTQVPNSVTL